MRKVEKQAIKDAQKNTKPPLKTQRVALDEFSVEVDGQEYFPHIDEWVDILPIRRMDELRDLMELVNFKAPDGEELTWTHPLIVEQYRRLSNFLSKVLYNWSITDDDGKELPRPYRNVEVVEQLTLDELMYVTAKLIGGRTEDSKNDSPPSPDT